jgi:hypothetical protein
MKSEKMSISEYAMIIGVAIGFVFFGLFIRAHIIYTSIKEYYHGKAKAFSKALRKT